MTEKTMEPYLFEIKEDERAPLLEWHEWIHHEKQRGPRAKLRRCGTLTEVLMQPGFHRLCIRLPRLEASALNGLALIAGILVWAESQSDKTLPELLGALSEGSDKPLFSELRFQRLLASESAEDLFKSLRRAIIQAGKKSEPLTLADSILHWFQQRKHPDCYQGQKQWQYCFAKPYYQQII